MAVYLVRRTDPHELVAAVASSLDRSIVPIGTVAEVVDGR
jgi:hypothetical protein